MGANNGHHRIVSGDLHRSEKQVRDPRDLETGETDRPLALPNLRFNYAGLTIMLLGSVFGWIIVCMVLGRLWKLLFGG